MIGQSLTSFFVLLVFLVQGAPASAPHLTAVISLEKVLVGKKTATVDAGGGVSLELTAVDGIWRQNPDHISGWPEAQEVGGRTFYSLCSG